MTLPLARNILIFALAAVFAALYAAIGQLYYLPSWAMLALAVVFFLLGIALVFLTLQAGETGKLKVFPVLAGACAAAIPVVAVLHNFVLHTIFFVLALLVLPLIFVIALVASAVLLANAGKSVSGAGKLLVGLVIAIVVAPLVFLMFTFADEGYEVTSEMVDAPPEQVDRVFVTAEVDSALMDVFYRSFEHSLISALESNDIAAVVSLEGTDPGDAKDTADEMAGLKPDAKMLISIEPLYRAHPEGYVAIVGTVFTVRLIGAADEDEIWRLSGKVDYIGEAFFSRPGYTAHEGIRKELAWHTTAAIVRTLMSDVLIRESAPIYTITEMRERHGQRTD